MSSSPAFTVHFADSTGKILNSNNLQATYIEGVDGDDMDSLIGTCHVTESGIIIVDRHPCNQGTLLYRDDIIPIVRIAFEAYIDNNNNTVCPLKNNNGFVIQLYLPQMYPDIKNESNFQQDINSAFDDLENTTVHTIYI